MKSFLFICAFVLVAASAWAEEVSGLISKGDALDAKLQNKQALEVYQAAEKVEPHNVQVLCKISRQYGLMMDDVTSGKDKQAFAEKALSYANQAAGLNPRDATAQLAVAICYGRLAPLLDNKSKLAYSKLVKEHVVLALALDPSNDLSYYVLGSWNLEVASLGAVTRTLAGIIYGGVPPATYEKAAEALEKAVKLNPKRIGTHVELGRAYFALGKKAEARQELNIALQMPNREKDDPEAKVRAKQALKDL